MENLEATDALARAERLTWEARRAGRWYGIYLVAFAAASALLGGLFGVVGNLWGTAVLTPLFVVFVGALTVWAQRKRTALQGVAALHGVVIGSWAVLWAVTVIAGSLYYQGRPAWWVAGGLAMAVPGVVGAVLVFRRTARR
jgi:uncharacterized membrane protein YjjP (DUF1212 family)